MSKAEEIETNGIVVIYRSKYGTTKRYAQWIAEELDAELVEVSDFSIFDLERYSTVIFGSSVHVGKIRGVSFLKDNWAVLSKKMVIVFASTGASKVEPKQQLVIAASLPAEIRQSIKYFPLPGAYSYDRLDFEDKLLMNFGPMRNLRFRAWLKRDKEAKEQLTMLGKGQDWTDHKALTPIIQCVHEKETPPFLE